MQEWWIVETYEQYSTVSSRFSSNCVPTKILKIWILRSYPLANIEGITLSKNLTIIFINWLYELIY